MTDIPLSLYVHVPWCVRKCPYCDFNSHQQQGELPEQSYVDALLADLDCDLAGAQGRPLQSIFIGGGTPSLFSAQSYQRLLQQLAKRLRFADDIEITLEANPGTFEQAKFRDFRDAGINRLSIGIQSFDAQQLTRLGRIHGRKLGKNFAKEFLGLGNGRGLAGKEPVDGGEVVDERAVEVEEKGAKLHERKEWRREWGGGTEIF